MTRTRRKFIREMSAGMAGAGLASVLPGSVAASKKTAAIDQVVIGMIGCRNMGFINARDFLKIPGVRLAAMADVDDSVLEKRSADLTALTAGSKRPDLYKDYRKLLERKDLDAVVISSPDHWHCLQMVHACQEGMDVYIEKPLANSIAECNIMRKAAAHYDRVVAVGQQQRSGNHWKSAMDFIAGGDLGKIRRVNIWANFNSGAGKEPVPDEPVPEGVDYDFWLGPAPARPFNPNRFHYTWRFFWDYGGGLMTDWGVHLIDMAIWAMDVQRAPSSVAASGGIFAHQDHALEVADTQSVIYDMDDFIISWEHNGGIQQGPYDRPYGIAFVGTNGTLVADREKWEVYPEWGDGDWRMTKPPIQFSDKKSHERHVSDFLRCIRTREKPAADIEVGYRAALFAHLGNVACKAGRKLSYDEASETIRHDREATRMLTPEYRAPWSLPNF